jgi:uncharacterized small protein (DUF1192 family)
MFEEEPRPRRPVAHEIGCDLTALSLHELRERIELLRAEIIRIEAEISAKDSTRSAAENLFSRT